MTVVVGTAGHIDHGKTTLLRALTGIDADRLPEEQRRGLTIDVGYAHGSPDGGPEIDFVDVPGHDRLVGNMLVGAGEIDACLLVVAADDGPRAQTWEHLGLLDAMGIERGIVVISKCDLVDSARVEEVAAAVGAALEHTALAGAPLAAVSATTGQGIEGLRQALAALRDELSGIPGRPWPRGGWLAIDRVFAIRGRGVVVTGTSRGRAIDRGAELRLLPGEGRARVRGIQVHNAHVTNGPAGGRVALNLAGVTGPDLRRGVVLVDASPAPDPLAVVETDRMLVVLRRPPAAQGRRDEEGWPPRDGSEVRLHIGTDQVTARLRRSGREAIELPDGRALATLHLDRPVAAAIGDRFVLRRPPPAALLAGGIVIDARPLGGPSRRRHTATALERLAGAVSARDEAATITALRDLRGHLDLTDGPSLADDVHAAALEAALEAVDAHHADHAAEQGMPLSVLRTRLASVVRAAISMVRSESAAAAAEVIDELVAAGTLLRDGDVVRRPCHQAATPDLRRERAKERLLMLLDAVAPPPLRAAAQEAGCPPDAIRELERAGRIVIVSDDLAWSGPAFDAFAVKALELATAAPLSPAALRDATGTSRKYVMALLEELDRRGVLRRTPVGHVPGPRS